MLQTSKIFSEAGSTSRIGWSTKLDASDSTPKEQPGAIRMTYDPFFGLRMFQYGRFDQSGGSDANQLTSFRAPISVTNITSGTTTSITLAGAAAFADEYAGGLLWCLDDAGAAGAAPEGEIAVITTNTTGVIEVDSNDAFSVAPAANDDFKVLLPWSFIDSAAGDTCVKVAGVTLVDQNQYDWGWVQCKGFHPSVAAIAAGTAITAEKGLIASTNVVTISSTSNTELLVGYSRTGLSTDTVRRTIPAFLHCGAARQLGASA